MENSDQDDVTALCERFDFPLANARESDGGEHLILEPTSLDQLPDAEGLGDLGDALRELGYRHISFAVEDRS